MSYRYKEDEIREANLLDAQEFNRAISPHIESLQNMDRDQLPHDAIGETRIDSGAMHQMLVTGINQENAAPYRFTDPADRPVGYTGLPSYYWAPGVTYNNYSGGGVVIIEDSLVCTGGLIEVDFSCWVWRDTFLDGTNDNGVPVRYQIALKVNGRIVSSSGQVASNWSNIHLVGTTVAPEGTTSISVEWYVTPRDASNVGVTFGLPQFCVGGTSLLAQNRRT